MKTNLLTLCIFFMLSLHLSAARYHVTNRMTAEVGNGLTWSTSLHSLQQALDWAVRGDTVWVAAGTYLPTKKYADIDRNGAPTTDRARSFIIPDSIVVMGGFPAYPTDNDGIGSRDWLKNRTILSGDFNRDDDSNFGNISDNAYHVVILIGASPKLVLDGFFIQSGNSNASQTAYYKGETANPIIYGCGGGIYCSTQGKKLSPTLRNLHVHSNFASYEGGGLYLVSEDMEVSPEISNVTFMNNKAVSNNDEGGHGGGLFVEGRRNTAGLTNVIIMGNSAVSDGSSYGGGAYFRAIEDCKPTLQNTLIAGNFADGGGGGAYFNSRTGTTEPVLTNATVSGNKAVQVPPVGEYSKTGGGGLMVTATLGDVNLVIRNTAVCDNLSFGNSARNEIFMVEGEGKSFDLDDLNSFVKGIDLDGASLSGETDPLFVAPAEAPFAPTGNQWFDYLPKIGSPLINKGVNSVVSTSKDLNGNARIYGGTVDIGAYESQGVDPPAFNDNIESKSIWSYRNRLFVHLNSPATLKVYSINGMLVKQINNLSAGIHELPLPQGIYVVELGNGTVKKIIIN
jgi:hypothetical protein